VTAEETKDAVKSSPRAVNYTLLTLFGFAAILLVLVPVLPPYTTGLPRSLWPIVESSVSAVYGVDSWKDPENYAAKTLYRVLEFFMMAPCQATTAMADLYACSRYIYGLSRGGFIPTELSVTYSGSLTDLELELDNSTGSQSVGGGPPAEHKPIVEGGFDRKASLTPVMARRLSSLPRSSLVPAKETSADNIKRNEEKGGAATATKVSPVRSPKRAVIAAGVLCISFNILVEIIRVITLDPTKNANSEVVDIAADNLLRMAVWFACLGYLVQLSAYIYIRLRMKNLQRPSPSPTGIPGVIAALVVTVVFGLIGPFLLNDPNVYIISVVVFLSFSLVFFIYYQIYALPRLTNSPERLFILYVFLLSIDFAAEHQNLTKTICYMLKLDHC
jgi:amino acid transporter